MSFEAKQVDAQVWVNWSTASETQTSHFELEMSENGNDWSTVSSIEASGNSQDIKTYQAKVNVNGSGVRYFRIKQVDMNGAFEYSDIFSATLQAQVEVSIYPNPTVGALNIKTSADQTRVVVKNTFGQIVVDQTSNENQIRIDLSSFQTGVYFVQMVANGQAFEKKIIKQ